MADWVSSMSVVSGHANHTSAIPAEAYYHHSNYLRIDYMDEAIAKAYSDSKNILVCSVSSLNDVGVMLHPFNDVIADHIVIVIARKDLTNEDVSNWTQYLD